MVIYRYQEQKESKNVDNQRRRYKAYLVLNQLAKLSINTTEKKHKKLNPMIQDKIDKLQSLDFEFRIVSSKIGRREIYGLKS
jgi:hypothetical protein